MIVQLIEGDDDAGIAARDGNAGGQRRVAGSRAEGYA
jgi:hypothetical protein